MFGNFSTEFLIYKIMAIPGLLLGFVLHEFAHAKMADRLGDPTPRSQGRITLDPKAHIDILGFIMIIIVGFGWAKPVMTNPRYYRNPKRDDILVSLAGPFMNLLISIVFLVFIKIIWITGVFSGSQVIEENIVRLFSITAIQNVLLFVLNLIPIPYFDGYHVIANLFNTWRYRFFTLLEQYNMIIFILLAVSGVFSKIITPPVNVIFNFLSSLILYSF